MLAYSAVFIVHTTHLCVGTQDFQLRLPYSGSAAGPTIMGTIIPTLSTLIIGHGTYLHTGTQHTSSGSLIQSLQQAQPSWVPQCTVH